MQQQDVSGRKIPRQSAYDTRSISADAIIAAPGPGDMTQAEMRQHRIKQWAAEAHRRPEEAWRHPDYVGKPGLRGGNFANQARR